MKRIILSVSAAFLLLIFIPSPTMAGTESGKAITGEATTTEASQATALLARLDKINEMDKSKMSLSEKRVLRKEVISIKSELKILGGGVYLSVGAIIIIILLLILLL